MKIAIALCPDSGVKLCASGEVFSEEADLGLKGRPKIGCKKTDTVYKHELDLI